MGFCRGVLMRRWDIRDTPNYLEATSTSATTEPRREPLPEYVTPAIRTAMRGWPCKQKPRLLWIWISNECHRRPCVTNRKADTHVLSIGFGGPIVRFVYTCLVLWCALVCILKFENLLAIHVRNTALVEMNFQASCPPLSDPCPQLCNEPDRNLGQAHSRPGRSSGGVYSGS